MKILVAEDEAIIILFYTKALKMLGHETTLAYDGEEAFGYSKSEKFDIIFMDINMPKMDGIQSALLIRNTTMNSSSLIYAVTAMPLDLVEKKCETKVFDKILTKPLSIETIKKLTS